MLKVELILYKNWRKNQCYIQSRIIISNSNVRPTSAKILAVPDGRSASMRLQNRDTGKKRGFFAAALKKYKKVTGSFRKRLRKSINWKEGTFKQDKNKRCAFLNDENLCDMYTALGEKSLCRTCKMYPRHVEEFEDVREMTLSVSCPEVARILLGKKEPVRFLTYESNKEEEYDDFDPFLYSKLVDARKVMINILQDRSKRLDLRVGLVLAIAHDLQVRIKREDIFSIDDVFEKYQTEKAVQFVEAKLSEDENYAFIKKMFRNQYLGTASS